MNPALHQRRPYTFQPLASGFLNNHMEMGWIGVCVCVFCKLFLFLVAKKAPFPDAKFSKVSPSILNKISFKLTLIWLHLTQIETFCSKSQISFENNPFRWLSVNFSGGEEEGIFPPLWGGKKRGGRRHLRVDW